MSLLMGLGARLRSLVTRGAAERRMSEEFRFHVEMETNANVERGLPRDEARRRALLSFGGGDRHRENMRDGRGARWVYDIVADVRYAVRTLLRSPGLSIAATITLAAGVGVNGIVFSTVNGLLFRPIPAEHAGRLVALYGLQRKSGQADGVAYEDFLDYRDKSGAFADLAAKTDLPLNVQATEASDMMWGDMVTENFFSVLGMKPVVGRFFDPAAVPEGTDPYAVLSYDSWRSRFGGEASVVGRQVRVNGTAFTVIGVAPKGFHGMRKFGFWPDVWVPLGMHNVVSPGSTNFLRGRGSGWATVIGRMRPGWTIEQTRTAVVTFARRLELEYPDANTGRGAIVIPAGAGFDNPTFVPPRTIVLASSLAVFAVTLLLLIVCANLANLLLARLAAREHELAVRLSLGCSRARLVRQLLVEAIVLALPGAVLGVAVILAAPAVQAGMLPHLQFQVGFDMSPDWHVALLTSGVAGAAVLLFGLAPALRGSRPTLVASLKSSIGEGGARARGRRLGMRSTLVVGQLAFSVILLVGGTLFLRSLLRARDVDLGFDARDRALISVNPALQGYDRPRGVAFYRDVLARVRSLPEVSSASWGFPVPFDTYGRSVSLYVDGMSGAPGDRVVNVSTSVVDPGFFDAVGIRLLDGRDFVAGDSAGAPRTMVVSRAMARRYWPGVNAIGQRARLNSAGGPEVTIAGVAADAKFGSVSESPQPHVYLPLSQNYRGWETLVVHARGPADRIAQALRAAVASADPALPAFGASSMDVAMDNALNMSETAASFAGSFGLLALIVASVGLYGLVANIVATRTREIGVRMALGATPWRVFALVVGRTMRLSAIGIGIGLVGAVGLGKALGGLLVGLSPHDPVSFVFVSVVLAGVVVVASYVPARRATGLGVAAALRE